MRFGSQAMIPRQVVNRPFALRMRMAGGAPRRAGRECKRGRRCVGLGLLHRADVAPISETSIATRSSLAAVLWIGKGEEFRDRSTLWWTPMLTSRSDEDSSRTRGSPERVGNPSDADLQRAEGCGHITVTCSERGTRIRDIYQRSPIRMLFPRLGGGPVEEAVLVNTAGGIAGGDRLESGVTALANAAIAVTSQAAEKVYRALNKPARVTTKLKAQEGAKLAWLPQETILFNRARLVRNTEIEISSGAELLALEWLVLGRAAQGEEVVGGYITDSWRVKKDGRLIWADCFRATDQVFPHLHRKALLSDCKAVGTLIHFGPHVETQLELFQAIASSLECHCAATLVGGLVVARFAASLPSDLRLALRSFLKQFSQKLGPGPFRVPKMWSC